MTSRPRLTLKAMASRQRKVPTFRVWASRSRLLGKADGKDGVVIAKVEPNSAAADRGVKKGDVILEVAGKSVAKPGDVSDALEAARADKKSSVLMRLRSGDASRYVAVPLANG